MKEKKWEILDKDSIMGGLGSIDEIVKILLKNRGIKTKKQIEEFLQPNLSSVTTTSVGIDQKQLTKALKRIQAAIEKKEQIIVIGDYDVDGITGTAILWETLYGLGASVVPYIPNRIDEGYGLSKAGISNVQSQITNIKLIITVDNGIVANDAVGFAKQQGMDVIITDHHTVGEKLPNANAIVHTTQVCGAGVAWLLSQEISSQFSVLSSQSQVNQLSGIQSDQQKTDKQDSENRKQRTDNRIPQDHLSLVALATVADLVSLTGANRVLLRFGLAELRNTKRPGLLALFQEAEIIPQNIGVYEIGHIIAPRLNAMGRLESAMDSLRLICTKDRLKAKVLADTLGRTNRERQVRTQSAAMHAVEQFRESHGKRKLLFIAHEEYEEGIIGLVAGKLVEEYYLPAIVLSKGEKVSKASARSIAGFNIIDFIRTHSTLLINAGGHPMAAGFTVETEKITLLQEALEKLAESSVDGEMLQRILRIDCQLPIEAVTANLHMQIQSLSPFGMGNPEPTFVSRGVIQDIKTVGKEKKHLKLKVTSYNQQDTNKFQKPKNQTSLRGASATKQSQVDRHASLAMTSLDAIAFGMGEKAKDLKPGDTVDIVYTISENVWNGRVSLQLKVKDIKLN